VHTNIIWKKAMIRDGWTEYNVFLLIWFSFRTFTNDLAMLWIVKSPPPTKIDSDRSICFFETKDGVVMLAHWILKSKTTCYKRLKSMILFLCFIQHIELLSFSFHRIQDISVFPVSFSKVVHTRAKKNTSWFYQCSNRNLKFLAAIACFVHLL
jgi:hypothetical protein